MEGGSSTGEYEVLENKILDGSSGPCRLPLVFLSGLTNNFSDERLLGEGGFGKVYKGVLQNGKMVAIKRLMLKPGVQEKQFENEVSHLMELKHPNIVRFLGYCYETQNERVKHDGNYIFAEVLQQKLICLEYLPKGSLDRHLSDESSGLEWHRRYKLIKGIFCGLQYLHEECKCRLGASIIHLDLKPENILLNEYMEPKIADFGLSRLFKDNKTQIATFVLGSRGYMAPEYFMDKIVTSKVDVFSLGIIIIEIIAGRSREVDIFTLNSSSTFRQEFMDSVINSWRKRPGGGPSETDCKQIKDCLEISLRCIRLNPKQRPTSREIKRLVDRWETRNCNVNSEKRLAADKILAHVGEKPSASITGNIISVTAREPGNGPRSGSSTWSRVGGLFHRQLSGVMRWLSGVMRWLSSVCLRMSLSLSQEGNDNDGNLLSQEGNDNDGNLLSYHDDDDAIEVELEVRSRGGFTRPTARSLPVFTRPTMGFSFEQMEAATMGFSFEQMEAATMGFSLEAKIGEGSFGTVYRGYLPDGREVAIKRRESRPRDDRHFLKSKFQSEVAFLSRLHHRHLVDLIGYCAANKERLLVCEYMKNGALYDHLHPKTKVEPSESSSPPSLVMSSWKQRIRILLDASRGIEYLHSYSVRSIIHGDVKSSNILLDASWRARVSDFGLSDMKGEEAHWNTDKAALTVGYTDPEYYSLHHLTLKSDVYSFGVVMLEVLTGKPAILEEPDDEGESPMSVVDYAIPSIISGELGKILDPRMPEPDAHEAEALGLVAFIAVHCVRLQGKHRPAMAGIVANLQTALDLCEDSLDGDLVESPSSDSLPVITPIHQD